MLLRRCASSIAISVAALVCGRAGASIAVAVDKLDPADGFPIPPSHLVVVDIDVAPSSDDAFYSVGVEGQSSSGARLIYAFDPNGVIPSAPGIQHRFVTFFSRARGRDDDSRFDHRGLLGMGGSYCGQPPSPRYTPAEVNAYGFYPLEANGVSGYVLRIVLDLSTVNNPAFQLDSPSIIVGSQPPPGSTILLQTSCPNLGGGAVVVSRFDQEHPVRFDFGIYGIPEPAAASLLLLALLGLARRRSGRADERRAARDGTIRTTAVRRTKRGR